MKVKMYKYHKKRITSNDVVGLARGMEYAVRISFL